MGKLETPAWIKEGYDSKADWEKKQKGKSSLGKKSESGKAIKGKIYKVKKCPKCGSANVSVVLIGEEGKKADNWECKKCKWVGRNIEIAEVGEDEFLALGEEK